MGIIDRYIKYIESFEGKSEHTINAYKTDIIQFVTFIDKDITEAEVGDVIRWIGSMEVSGSTKKRKLKSLNSIYQYIIGIEKTIKDNPVSGIKVDNIKTKSSLPKYFKAKEVKKMLKCVDNVRDSALIDFLFNTGLRISELAALDRDDVYDANEVIIVGKGGKERVIYINDRLKAVMKNYIDKRQDDKSALFLNKYGDRLSIRGISKMFSKYLTESELDDKGYTVHSTRHTCFTMMLSKGIPITTIQKIAGHSDIATTMIYAKALEEDVKKAVLNFDIS